MEILRVERSDKLGPYSFQAPYVMGCHHPCPTDDPELQHHYRRIYNVTDWYYGFKDLNQLLQWFPKEGWHVYYDYNDVSSLKSGIQYIL